MGTKSYIDVHFIASVLKVCHSNSSRMVFVEVGNKGRGKKERRESKAGLGFEEIVQDDDKRV